MDVAALDRQARLPGVHECAPHGAAGGDVQVDVVEHDHGVLAAQLQHHGQQLPRGRFAHAPAGRHASSEHDFVDGRLDERRPGRTFADHHLHEIGIQASRNQ